MLKNILLAVITTLICLFFAELFLRWMSDEEFKPAEEPKKNWALVPERVWTEHHPVLGWYHQKNKTAVLEKAQRKVEIHTNAEGFRGTRNYSRSKPEGIKRVLVLGDSFFFGWAVRDEDVLSSRLEQMMPALEAPNLSVAGYGIDQILMAYRTVGKKYDADYVLIGIFPEDFWRATRAFADSGHAKPYFSLSPNNELVLHNVPVPAPFTLKTNQFPDIIRQSPFEDFLEKSRIYRNLKRGLFRLGKNLRLVDPDTTEEWILGKEILQALMQEIQADGAEPILVIVPPDRWIKRDKPTSLLRSLYRFASHANVEIVDLTPIFQKAVAETDLGEYYIEGDGHWTEKGHALAAETIASSLFK